MDNMLLADNIRYYRRDKNLSQFELAEIAGINEKTVTRAESGKITIKLDILYKIAKALDIPVFKLFVPHIKLDTNNKDLTDNILLKLSVMNKSQLRMLDKIVDVINETRNDN